MGDLEIAPIVGWPWFRKRTEPKATFCNRYRDQGLRAILVDTDTDFERPRVLPRPVRGVALFFCILHLPFFICFAGANKDYPVYPVVYPSANLRRGELGTWHTHFSGKTSTRDFPDVFNLPALNWTNNDRVILIDASKLSKNHSLPACGNGRWVEIPQGYWADGRKTYARNEKSESSNNSQI